MPQSSGPAPRKCEKNFTLPLGSDFARGQMARPRLAPWTGQFGDVTEVRFAQVALQGQDRGNLRDPEPYLHDHLTAMPRAAESPEEPLRFCEG